MKRITFKTGPLKGKTYDVPVSATRHDLAGGHYEIDGDTAKWRAGRAEATQEAHDELRKAMTLSDAEVTRLRATRK